MTSKPVALILAGPNGAGRTTVSSVFVGPDVEFVNADIIGAELRRDDPHRPGADVTAGRIVSARLRALTAERRSFCFETNLASPGLVGLIDGWRADGYEVRLVFVALPNVDLALAPSGGPCCRRWSRRTGGDRSSPLHCRAAVLLHALSPPSRRMGAVQQRRWWRSRADREWGPPRGARARRRDVRQTPSEVERDFEVE